MDHPEGKNPSSTPSRKTGVPAKAEKNFRPLWLAVAALALVAAFLFQWKNSVDQASIAETADGRVLRAKVEGSAFRIFSSDKNRPVREAFLCGGNGEILARLVPANNGEAGLFRLPSSGDATDADFFPEKLPREGHFLHLVLPAEKTAEGQPVVLLVQNPFKNAGTPAEKP